MRARQPRRCDRVEARARLKQARGHLDAAVLMLDENGDVAASDAVLAGIAASDAICCSRLGERSSDADHAAAVRLLHRADPKAANLLQRLLNVKGRAQYDHRTVGKQTAASAIRWATGLIEQAAKAVA